MSERGAVLEVVGQLLAEGEAKPGQAKQVLSVVKQLLLRNAELEQRLSHGYKNSEAVSSQQLLLLIDSLPPNGELAEVDEKLRLASAIVASRFEEDRLIAEPKPAPRLRRPVPENLRRVDNPIAVPAAERPCPRCGKERECIGHDTSEVVELIPAEVIVRRDLREKLACRACESEVVRAPTADKVVQGGRLGTTLVAQLLVDKYRDGLPLHRQKERFARLRFDVAVSTLADQVTWATDLLRPLWRAAMATVLSAKVMHLDATGLPVLDEKSARGIKLGSLWGYVGRDQVDTALYLYASTGKKESQRPGELGPADVLSLRSGYVVADAATLFDKSFEREGITECGCNMHARRYFTKALDGGDARAALPLAAFKSVYELEQEVRDRDDAARLSRRQEHSVHVYDELVAWCRAHKPAEPPSSPLGKAIGYLLNNEIALRRFLDDGAVPIDNGIVERLHVRTALTRKNFLFAGSDAGGERAAMVYTLLGCCQLAEVDPVAYLADVLPRLSRRIRLVDVPALLPSAWKASRATAAAAT
jgi:transposase